MKARTAASLILIGSAGGLFAADYTWNQTSGETWQEWGNPANWLVNDSAPTAAPGADSAAGDTVKRNNKGKKVTWCWDLGGGGVYNSETFHRQLVLCWRQRLLSERIPHGLDRGQPHTADVGRRRVGRDAFSL